MPDFIQKVVTVLISQVSFGLFLFLLFQFTLLDKPSTSLDNFNHPIRNFSCHILRIQCGIVAIQIRGKKVLHCFAFLIDTLNKNFRSKPVNDGFCQLLRNPSFGISP